MALQILKRSELPAPVALVQERVQLGKDDRLEAERRWALNQAFYEGRQWVYYDRATNRIATPPAPSWMVRHTANYVTPMVYTLMAKLTKKHPVMTARPATGEEEDIGAARRSTKLLEYMWAELGLTQPKYQLVLWFLICGKAFLKPYWDPTAGDLYVNPDLPAENGNPTMFRLGDVAVPVVSPWRLLVDPAANESGSLDGAEWVCEESIQSVEYIESVYGVKVEPEDVSALQIGNLGTAQMSGGDDGPFGRTAAQSKLSHHAILREYWQRPSDRYPDGRLICVAHDTLLNDDRLPYGKPGQERDWPYVEFSHVLNPGRFWCRSLVEDLIGPQKGVNVGFSRLMMVANLMSAPKIMAMRGSLDIDKWTGDPGEIIEYAGTPPTPWTPQVFPQGIFELIQLHLDTMYKISGVREFSLSGAPSGAHSGIALNLLAEQDDTRLGPVVDAMEDGFARVGTKMLELVQGDGTPDSPYGYVEPRTLSLTGENGLVEVEEFMGANLRFGDVVCEAGSGLPRTKAGQQAFVMELVQAHILDPQQDRDMILKMLDVGSFDPMADDIKEDELRAELENRRMTGVVGNQQMPPQPQIVQTYDNHAAHLLAHNRRRRKDDFDKLPPEVQALFAEHVAQHEQMMVAEQQKQAVMAAMPQVTAQMVPEVMMQQMAQQQALQAAAQQGIPPPPNLPAQMPPMQPPPAGVGAPGAPMLPPAP